MEKGEYDRFNATFSKGGIAFNFRFSQSIGGSLFNSKVKGDLMIFFVVIFDRDDSGSVISLIFVELVQAIHLFGQFAGVVNNPGI